MPGPVINGELIRAQLENLAADPSAGISGRVYYNTVTGRVKVDTATILSDVLANDQHMVMGTHATPSNNLRWNRSGAGYLQLVTADQSTAEGTVNNTAVAQLDARQPNYVNASVPAFGNAGRLVWVTDSALLKIDNGASWLSVVDTTTAQTLTNKTLTSPTINTPTVAGAVVSDSITFTQVATPSTPSAGKNKIYPKTDGYFYSLDPSGAERKIGSGAGSINYMQSNPDAESGVTGWSTYANGAAAPTTGSGGSPTLTFVSDASTVLRGTKNFKLTPGALGNGAVFSITPDQADRATMLSVSFDYVITTPGSYTDGDLQVWIIDSNTGAVIQPAPYKILGSSLPSHFSCEFQAPSTLTTMLVLIHQATATTTYGSVRFDNFQCGPTLRVYGMPTTDATAFTPSTTNGPAYSVGPIGKWKRDGDYLEVWFYLTASGTGSAGIMSMTVPMGLTIDSTKLPVAPGAGACKVGHGTFLTNSSGVFAGVSVYAGSTTTLSFIKEGATGSLNGSTSFAASDQFDFYARIPITGWSSNVLMSQDTDSRVCAMNASTPNGTPSTSYQTLNYQTTNVDTHGSLASGVYTVAVPGQYEIIAALKVNGTVSAGATAYIDIRQNATTSLVEAMQSAGGNTEINAVASVLYTLKAGDTISARGKYGGTITSPTWNQVGTYLSIKRLTGPAAIAASESVCVRYTTAAGQSVSVATIVNFGTVDFDSHGSVTVGASWKFTAPSPGKYRVDTAVLVNDAAWSATQEGILGLYKNGSLHSSTSWIANASATLKCPFTGSFLVNMLAGDTLDVRATTPSHVSLPLTSVATANFISITRVGN